jgi:peptidoglycan/LPS O-acetylase OafA/YrhL/lysophospholipase L1-like esterase
MGTTTTTTRAAATARATMPYVAAVDGLRAIAVLAVVVFHFDSRLLPGGFFGVEVFFVVSGFLITSLLVGEHDRSGAIDRIAFWSRRAWRLLPLLFVSLVATLLVTIVLAPSLVRHVLGDSIAGVGYVSNWYQIVRGESYFESFTRPSPLRHLWSLAIEEQFYLAWPLVFGALWTVLPARRKAMAAGCVGVALASTALLAVWYQPYHDPTRVYYGTDTRLSGLLLGAALAMVYRPWERPAPRVRDQFRLSALGLVSLVGLLLVMRQFDEFHDRTYLGGFLLVDLLTLAVLVAVLAPSGWLRRWLSSSWLVWVGVRSYAIYLIHWPVVVFTRPGLDVPISGFGLFVVRGLLTLGLAEVAHRYVEKPLRRGVTSPRTGLATPLAGPVARRNLKVLGGVVAAAASLAMVLAVTVEPPRVTVDSSGNVVEVSETATTTLPVVVATTTTVPGVVPPVSVPAPVPVTAPKPPLPSAIVIGDSVALGATPALKAAFGGDVVVDAAVGRQSSVLGDVVGYYLAQERLPGNVVIHLGNNGLVSESALQAVLDQIGPGRRVFIVNVRVPKPWAGKANSVLERVAESDPPRIRLVDWYGASAGHGNWFAADGVHLTEAGGAAYAQLIAGSVAAP